MLAINKCNAMQPKIHRQDSPATERAGPWAVLCASVTVPCSPAHSTHVLLCAGERGYFRGLGVWAFGRFARFERWRLMHVCGKLEAECERLQD